MSSSPFETPSAPVRVARRLSLILCCALVLPGISTRQAQAGPIGLFQNFVLTNTNADGTAESLDGISLLLTGPNNGSGDPGTTDFVTTVTKTGIFQYDYVYYTTDDPCCDFASFLLNGVAYWLADTNGESGILTLPVIAGDTVGFRISSTDNTGEAGSMMITNFSSADTTGLPEPGCFSLMLIAMGGLGAVRRRLQFLRALRIAVAPAAALVFLMAQPLAAQSQTEYTGTNVTGSLALVRVVNLTQQAQASHTLGAKALAVDALAADALTATPVATGEPWPKFSQKRLSPPLWTGVSTLSPHATLGALASISSLAVASTQGLTVTTASGMLGLNALSHADQRNANNGNQFSIEPPSPSIAVSSNYVLEGVNDAVQVYLPSGTPVLPVAVSSNQVFGLAPAIVRATGVNGVYLTDMRVYFDPGINTWFIVQRAQDNDVDGNPLNSSHLYVAVSRSADPTGDYNIYVMDTTNQAHPGCPCIADYPQLGSDQYGFHIAWNEFTTALNPSYVDAAILTLSKAGLSAGAATPTAYQFLLPYSTGYEFAIQPATTPPGASNFVASAGIEFFVSTLARSAYNGGISLWAMRNTSSIATSNPNPILARIVVSTLSYSVPDVATQRAGALPYGWSLSPVGQLAFLDGGDCRVQALSYSGARLYLTFPTAVRDEAGIFRVGGAYVVLSPTYRSGVLAGSVLNQGYLVVNGNHLLRPAIAVNPQGRGAIAATLVGPDWYPSAVSIPFDNLTTPLTLQVAATGALPEDGFTGYPDGGGYGLARWGDYNTAVAGSDGAIWMVTEYIGNYPRTDYANWNTYIARKQP